MMRANRLRRLSGTLGLSGVSFLAVAQDTTVQGSTGGMMTSNGKIGVVMVVCLTILVGLILYLVRLDRKISKLEKK